MADRVLVTGSASGLGRAVAARFLRAGHRVLVSDVDGDRAEASANELGAQSIRLDVTDDGDWAAARDWCEREWGGLDVLVNNAGVAAGGRFEKVGIADWDWIWEINVKGVIRGCRTFVPDFKARRSGHLVNVASLAAIMNLPAMSSYNVTKAAVLSLSDTLRLELEPYGVRTTVVCPGFVRTNLNERLRSPDPAIARLMDKLMASSTVTPDDVAEQVYDAVARGRFLVLTHTDGRRSALLKRFGLTDGQVRKYWARLRGAVEKGDT
ncbi:SDR family oxidoreductase [Actinophytocola oryzae]|uniref:NADP-dependent 3-hydroxy acid dehydrogenase YdfG n=1 Tax=Actinophytocola oryzae TaxID=502181 RepID=A0A4R7VRB3_9PSEU|nr:SDR family oxidoreductase [Actinophytocola oryzae]TDV51995.1 NADP-dependent 3-hydroxy acid dehydrogenase YdfG [Actinophytocola oryzae]